MFIRDRLASVLATDDYSVRDLLDHPYMAKKCVKTLMIPTTAGTGAEATPNAIVAVPEKELKVGIVNDAMIADGVILDARMIKLSLIHILFEDVEPGVQVLVLDAETRHLPAREAYDVVFSVTRRACRSKIPVSYTHLPGRRCRRTITI